MVTDRDFKNNKEARAHLGPGLPTAPLFSSLLDKLAVLVRAEKGGKAKLRKMLVMLEIVENEGDGVILSKKKGVHLSRSLTDAGWKRANPRKPGSPWLPPPE